MTKVPHHCFIGIVVSSFVKSMFGTNFWNSHLYYLIEQALIQLWLCLFFFLLLNNWHWILTRCRFSVLDRLKGFKIKVLIDLKFNVKLSWDPVIEYKSGIAKA